MFKDSEAFSGYSIDDVDATRTFYSEILGLEVTDLPGIEQYGMLELHVKNGHNVLLYHKDDHQPATFTVLSFPVEDIDTAVKELTGKGVSMLRYDNPDAPQDELGITRGLDSGFGPDIAWFNDPSGNSLAVLQTSK